MFRCFSLSEGLFNKKKLQRIDGFYVTQTNRLKIGKKATPHRKIHIELCLIEMQTNLMCDDSSHKHKPSGETDTEKIR